MLLFDLLQIMAMSGNCRYQVLYTLTCLNIGPWELTLPKMTGKQGRYSGR